MKLCEMAQEYRVNVALLELRIKQLQAAQKRARQPEVRYRLKQRAKFLQTLINESRQTVLLRKALNYGVFNSRKKRQKSHIKRTLSRFLNARKFKNRVFWNADLCAFSYLFMPSCRQFVVRFPVQSSYFSIASASLRISCSPY